MGLFVVVVADIFVFHWASKGYLGTDTNLSHIFQKVLSGLVRLYVVSKLTPPSVKENL